MTLTLLLQGLEAKVAVIGPLYSWFYECSNTVSPCDLFINLTLYYQFYQKSVLKSNRQKSKGFVHVTFSFSYS